MPNASDTTPQEGNPEAASQAAPAANGAAPSVAELEAQVKEKESKYLYLYAEFENFKKRAVKDREDARKFGWEGIARDLLQVLDNLDRAIAHLPPATDKNLVDGLNMVVSQFQSTVARQGVQRVESLGKPFDPNLHDAVSYEPSTEAAGMVTQELSKGYTLYGRLLRPARVMVSSGPANTQA